MSIIVMTDDDFEENMQFLSSQFNPVLADSFRARDTAQRDALARVEAERDYCKRIAEHNKAVGGRIAVERNTAQVQLAEAVGILRKLDSEVWPTWGDSGSQAAALYEVKAFLACHAHAEQQEAISDAELMEVAMFAGSGNKAARRAHELGMADLPEHLAPQQEAQGAQAGDEFDIAAEAIFNADKDNWYSAGPYPQLHANDKARLRAMARAALATQPAAGEPVYQYRGMLDDWIEIPEGIYKDKERLGYDVRTLWAAPPAAAPAAAGEPVYQWEDSGLWSDCGEAEQASARANGFKTRTLWTAPPAAVHGDEAPGTVRVTADWLKKVHRDLDACQKVIWLAGCRPRVPGGFDPAYCEDAQARLKEIDEHIARAQGDGGEA